ncbi:hypothetical protein KUTeg_005923 [Tegillarca granosa]|uniref:Transposase n=1 Tax=Tegillarca granosa TaxID=220873 RepID=A0ABQ9FIN1_TEGGR|nr:hypothetical protein KUTeg_005923 [Tegillarca granosa]
MPFKTDTPGKDWIQGFLARHPDLSIRSQTALSTVRARIELGLENAPKKIWNIDETSVALTHNPTKVLAETGIKNIPGRVENSRDNVSVLAAVNAAGDAKSPMICSEFMTTSPGNIVCKWKWPALFRAAYEKAFTPSNIISGFQKSGIFPFDPSKMTDQAFAPSQPFDCFNKNTANT